MDKESFIEFMRIGNPEMAAMVDEGYCSWEDLGYEGDGAEGDALIDDIWGEIAGDDALPEQEAPNE